MLVKSSAIDLIHTDVRSVGGFMFVYEYYESDARLNIFNEVLLIQRPFEAHVSFPLLSERYLSPRPRKGLRQDDQDNVVALPQGTCS